MTSALERRLPRSPLRTLVVSATCLIGSMATASAASLIEIYEQSRSYDATIQAAFHDLESARLSVPIARSAFRPQLNFSGSTNATNVRSDGDGTFIDNALQLELSQTLYNRQSSALVDQAQIGVMQAEALYASQSQDLILRVATAYFDVLRADANVEFSQSELQAIARQREQAERRFDVGLIPVTDVRTAQAAYDLAIAQEIAASNQLQTAQEALRVISGVETELLSQLADDLPLVRPDPANVDQWVDLARDQNLPLVIARLTADSARSGISVERGQRYPTIALTASANTLDSETTSEGDRRDSAEIGLVATMPLYTGGRIKAEVAQAQAEWLSSTADLDAQERSAVQQARDGYRGVVASIARVRALNQALVSTQQSADAVEAGFRAGTRTSVEVLNALRDVFSARADYANARYDYILNSFQLKSAAGILDESDLLGINSFLVSVQ